MRILRISRSWNQRIANESTEICVEAVPRSANTFFTMLIKRWNPSIIMAHHTHGAANVKLALRYNVPTIIIIREPGAACASSIIRNTAWMTAADSLASYIAFHGALVDDIGDCMVFRFSDVIQHPDLCLEEMNNRFNVGLTVRTYNNEERDSVFNQTRNQPAADETVIAQKKALRDEVLSCHLFEEARRLFDIFDARAADPLMEGKGRADLKGAQ